MIVVDRDFGDEDDFDDADWDGFLDEPEEFSIEEDESWEELKKTILEEAEEYEQ